MSARVSNISSATTKDALADFFLSKGMPITSRPEHISLITAVDSDGPSSQTYTAVVSFADEPTLKKALSLTSSDRMLNNRILDFDDSFDGYTVLSEGTQVDIVALHGLNGHAFRSWEYYDSKTRERFMWLRDRLPEQIPAARVITYGYNANVYSDVSMGRMRTFAETFLERLRYIRERNPALIIAHNRADKRYNSIINSVSGIVFLGTPHQGGNGVDTARFVANFVRAFNIDVRVDLIKSLDPRSMVLFDLTDDFRQLVSSKGIEIASLFETKKTKIGIFSQVWINPHIVEERSATLGVIRERKTAINTNHSNICKFRNSTDSSLISTLQALKEFCKDVVPAISSRHQSTQPPPPDDLKYVSLSDPGELDSSKEYPVLILGQYTYWGKDCPSTSIVGV
ncbi:hypothetical protein HHX47_DHR8000394 [Lentinula edodes]|nr:hypothetical protein HHX47_DHR8000394 [Lentinula edodes]